MEVALLLIRMPDRAQYVLRPFANVLTYRSLAFSVAESPPRPLLRLRGRVRVGEPD